MSSEIHWQNQARIANSIARGYHVYVDSTSDTIGKHRALILLRDRTVYYVEAGDWNTITRDTAARALRQWREDRHPMIAFRPDHRYRSNWPS